MRQGIDARAVVPDPEPPSTSLSPEGKQLSDRLAAILAATHDAVIGSSADGLITEWNRAAERIFGYRAEDIIGKPLTILQPVDVGEEGTERATRSLDVGDDREVETVWLDMDGQRIPVALAVSVVRDSATALGHITIVRDLTAEHEARAARHVLEKRLELKRGLLAEAEALAHLGSWEVDVLTDHVTWSEEMARIFEMTLSDLTRDALVQRIHPDDRELLLDARMRSMQTGEQAAVTYRLLLPSGGERTIEARWRFFHDSDAILIRGLGTCQDVTERHRAQKSIHLLANNLSEILETISDGFFAADREWRVIYINGAAERILHKKRGEIVGRSVWDVLGPNARATAFGRQLEQTASTMVGTRREDQTPNGSWYDVRACPSPSGISVYFRDVTEHRRIMESLRTFALRVDAVQDAERSAIAREVHDEIGQSLTALRMDAKRLSILCSGDEERRALVIEMMQLIDDTLESVRNVAVALHPIALDDLGLAAAVEIQVGHVARRARLRVALDLDEDVPGASRPQARVAYRVLQECLTNVVRHARAEQVSVYLARNEKGLTLEVADDGIGIDLARIDPPGASATLGLLSMRERAATLDGSLTVVRIAPHGTRITLHLPTTGSESREAVVL
jgi:PAS domain S-box-containing protein